MSSTLSYHKQYITLHMTQLLFYLIIIMGTGYCIFLISFNFDALITGN